MELEKIKTWLGTGSINIFGRPFAGKDTQGRILAEAFGGAVVGGGEILRNSTIPSHVNDALRRGELAPTDEYTSIVLPYLSQKTFSRKPLVLSSVGRWIGEEKGVVQALEQSDHPLKAVIYLDLSEEAVIDRWKALEMHNDRGGRYDDTIEILEKRLAEFRQKTLPVLAEYEKMQLLIRINVDQPPEKVTRDIIQELTMRT